MSKRASELADDLGVELPTLLVWLNLHGHHPKNGGYQLSDEESAQYIAENGAELRELDRQRRAARHQPPRPGGTVDRR